MKKSGIITIAIVLIFFCSGVSIADKWKNESRKGRPEISQYKQGRPDYHKYDGYRERPYNRGRHYGHYKHKGHLYDYRGHWRSWDQWDRYRRKHPDVYEHGHYYREKAHLMFRFCEPGTGNCFFFSIGR
jgi:hypothetical protein